MTAELYGVSSSINRWRNLPISASSSTIRIVALHGICAAGGITSPVMIYSFLSARRKLLAILYCNVTDVKTNRLRIKDVRCENGVKMLLVTWPWDRLLDFQVDTPLYESTVLGKQNQTAFYRSGDVSSHLAWSDNGTYAAKLSNRSAGDVLFRRICA